MTYGLSKSKLMAYRQCPRRLWLSVHEPDRALETKTATAAFATGHEVGAVARALYPGGQLIPEEGPLDQALQNTAAALGRRPRHALFEATVSHKELLVRVDILKPARSGWDLIEVKSATRVKDHYYEDVAIQAHALQEAGIPVHRCILQGIDSTFVYPGHGCYHEVLADGSVNSLFWEEDLTCDIRPLMKAVASWRKAAQKTLAASVMPPSTDHCEDPYPCPFIGFCHEEKGPDYPLSYLPRLSAKERDRLTALGYQDIRDIPPRVLTNETQEWVRAVTAAQRPDLRPEAAASLKGLGYPRYYLDFETIQFAVPIWQGTRPYEQLPFQWSCHIEQKDGAMTHQGFLDLSGDRPLRAFAERLIGAVKTSGPIFVYNQGFEGRVIAELAARFADLKVSLQALILRLVDLLPLTRQHYYHPDMKGSWSIKSVVPTIAPDLDYAQLDGVQDGGEAQQAYREAIDPNTPVARKRVIEQSLFAYCARDTEAMARLAHFLTGSASQQQ
ncbi:DUF2779 domain-containing protein [Acidiferrobacter sp.]|uniref:DUF2779 domain-containing protein n=1 Tax=Acidiferrobacter sp. TaxID=1872107 RepID=UPI0026294731|nr:DUF2779 domain-containing protein [Acidiferrobacter sp.]